MSWDVFSFLRKPAGEKRFSPLSFQDWVNYFSFGNNTYTLGGSPQVMDSNFAGYVEGAYKANGVIFACELARLLPFSEARFQFQALNKGRPGDLYGTAALEILETPWPGGTTGDLLARAIQDADFAGNFYVQRQGGQLRRLRPDWVTIVLGSRTDADATMWDSSAELLGYAYQPGGPGAGRPVEALLPEEVAHFAPHPDPLHPYRGMPWITPVLREIMSDNAAMDHKLKFFENGATPNLVVSFDANLTKEAFDQWQAEYEAKHAGVFNAYKTLFLGGGATLTSVGSQFGSEQMDFKAVQAIGETRIAAAAGVPPIIVGLSEGLQSATYSNYAQARRRYADMTLRPTWRNFAGSLQRIIPTPRGSRLWYDDRDVPFLREDAKDNAGIKATESVMIRALVDGGFDPASVIAAVNAGDWDKLTHTGLLSVQLIPPMPEGEPAPEPAAPKPAPEKKSDSFEALQRTVAEFHRPEEEKPHAGE